MPDIEGDGGTEVASDSEPVESESDAASGLINDSVRGNLSFVGGILGGGISYVVGFVVTFLMFGVVVESESVSLDAGAVSAVDDETGAALAMLIEAAPETLGAALSVMGWIFYNAHGVGLNVVGEDSVNLVVLTEPGLLPFALVPAVLLFVFGGLVALLKRADGLLGGFISGASVVLGYLPLAIAGALLARLSAGGETVAVQLLPAILLAGVLFPLLFGGLAGLTKVLVINVFLGGIRARL